MFTMFKKRGDIMAQRRLGNSRFKNEEKEIYDSPNQQGLARCDVGIRK